MPRPEQLNINVATWGRLLKRNLNFQKSLPESGGGGSGSGERSTSIRGADPTTHQSSTGKNVVCSMYVQYVSAMCGRLGIFSVKGFQDTQHYYMTRGRSFHQVCVEDRRHRSSVWGKHTHYTQYDVFEQIKVVEVVVVVVRLHADEQQRRVDDDDGMIFLGGQHQFAARVVVIKNQFGHSFCTDVVVVLR